MNTHGWKQWEGLTVGVEGEGGWAIGGKAGPLWLNNNKKEIELSKFVCHPSKWLCIFKIINALINECVAFEYI